MPSDRILAQKQEQVKNLAEEFKSAQTLVIASSRGLTVAQDTEMRATMREVGITFKVVKNSLALRAAQEIGLDELTEVFVGPTAIAYSTEDIVMPAKLAKQFAKKFEPFEIKGGAIDGVVSTLEEIDRLASIPDQETLYTQLAYVLNFPLTKFAATLKAVIDKAEEEGKDQVMDVVARQVLQRMYLMKQPTLQPQLRSHLKRSGN